MGGRETQPANKTTGLPRWSAWQRRRAWLSAWPSWPRFLYCCRRRAAPAASPPPRTGPWPLAVLVHDSELLGQRPRLDASVAAARRWPRFRSPPRSRQPGIPRHRGDRILRHQWGAGQRRPARTCQKPRSPPAATVVE